MIEGYFRDKESGVRLWCESAPDGSVLLKNSPCSEVIVSVGEGWFDRAMKRAPETLRELRRKRAQNQRRKPYDDEHRLMLQELDDIFAVMIWRREQAWTNRGKAGPVV